MSDADKTPLVPPCLAATELGSPSRSSAGMGPKSPDLVMEPDSPKPSSDKASPQALADLVAVVSELSREDAEVVLFFARSLPLTAVRMRREQATARGWVSPAAKDVKFQETPLERLLSKILGTARAIDLRLRGTTLPLRDRDDVLGDEAARHERVAK